MTDIVKRLRGITFEEEWLDEAAAEIERLRSRNVAIVESLKAHKCNVDNRVTVGECQQCGCVDGLLIQSVTADKEQG